MKSIKISRDEVELFLHLGIVIAQLLLTFALLVLVIQPVRTQHEVRDLTHRIERSR
jgi:cell division protein FtsL